MEVALALEGLTHSGLESSLIIVVFIYSIFENNFEHNINKIFEGEFCVEFRRTFSLQLFYEIYFDNSST